MKARKEGVSPNRVPIWARDLYESSEEMNKLSSFISSHQVSDIPNMSLSSRAVAATECLITSTPGHQPLG